MHRYLALLGGVLFFLSLLHTSCINQEPKRSDTLAYEIKKLSHTLNQCNIDSPNCAYISYNYPVFTDKTAIADSLNSIVHVLLGESDKTTLAQTQQTFLSEYTSSIKQNPGSNEVWYSETAINIPFQSAEVVCIGLYMNDYTGGAHGRKSQIYSCYHTKKNKALTMRDLFSDANHKQLLVTAEKTFRTEKGLIDTTDLESSGYWFKDNQFHLNENFVITSNGIDWIYNPYEVASYADGILLVSLKKEDLTPLLNKDFISIWD